jgi:hypothetical protein
VVLQRIIARVLSNGSAGWLQEAGGSKDATSHKGTHCKPKAGPSYSGLLFHSVRSLWSGIKTNCVGYAALQWLSILWMVP